jgi:glycogen debranching enzyme
MFYNVIYINISCCDNQLLNVYLYFALIGILVFFFGRWCSSSYIQRMKILFLTILVGSVSFCRQIPERIPIKMDEMALFVAKGDSREVAYTNKQAGVFHTETNGIHRSGWQGWRVMSTEILENYSIGIDGKNLNPSYASAEAYPHQLVRKYTEGITETFTLLDSIDAFVVELDGLDGKELSINPYFTNSFDPNDYEIILAGDVLLIANKKHLIRTQNENYPVWIGITIVSRDKFNFVRSSDTINTSFSPVNCQWSIVNGQLSFLFAAGDTKLQTISLAKHVAQNYQVLIDKRKKRMENLLNYSYVRTNNKRFDKALYWAKISMDALIMNQRGKGIFAGLPWFDNYWGRDSFISLAGATLVTGNFKDAKEILKSFSAWQDTNPNSTNYGRIPNLVTTNSISYNTADGTPRFVIALNDYLNYSGDTSFAREMYPVIKRSIEGTIKYHMDSLGFLTHGDAETWMDAVGPDGAWSPRGNRANDIQMLWYDQLRTGVYFAFLFRDTINQVQLPDLGEKVIGNFRKYFFSKKDSLIFDHLNADGTPDMQFRPNQLLGFADYLCYGSESAKIFQTITSELVYPYGVASLSQNDPNFHPYHHYEPFYVQDAAYHNGIVWTWLAGKWIDAATRYRHADLAYEVTENMVNQILDQGAIGTLSELIDAAPRAGEDKPRLSGTYSQAWSLAEFIRNFYESYLGIDMFLGDKKINIKPSLPVSVSNIDFILNYDSSSVYFQIAQSEDDFMLFASSSESKSARILFVDWEKMDRSGAVTAFNLYQHGYLNLTMNQYGAKITDSGNVKYYGFRSHDSRFNISNDDVDYTSMDGLKLAKPFIDPVLKCLQTPSHRLFSNSEIKQSNPQAKILYDVSDPEGDDNGSGSYIYPQTINLKPGSLDITHFTVLSDEKNIYFKLQLRNLSNPGWHPEYGFQLTYAAIAIDKNVSNGETNVGMNSNFKFTDGFKFQNMIYGGGGLRVVNDSGNIVAEYLPIAGDEKNPLGNANAKLIEFSLPIDLIGVPDNLWRYAVLVGAQDDHGGAGIGEFRSVDQEAKEWTGGGKKNINDPNVYDLILP